MVYTFKIYFWSIIELLSPAFMYFMYLGFAFLALIHISPVIPGSLLLPAYFYDTVLYLINLFTYSCFHSVGTNSDVCGLGGSCLLLLLSLLVFTSLYVWGLSFWVWVEENLAGMNGACFLQVPLASVSAEIHLGLQELPWESWLRSWINLSWMESKDHGSLLRLFDYYLQLFSPISTLLERKLSY